MIRAYLAPPEQRRQVLSVLFANVPAAERDARIDETLQVESCGELSLDGLITAEQDGQPAGAGLVVVQKDRTAFVWPPIVTAHKHRNRVADAILDAISQQMDCAKAWIGQCLLEEDQQADRAALTRNGYNHLLDLLFLQRSLLDPLPARASVSFETECFDPARNHDLFAALLEQTYVKTRDCPEINGLRTGQEALAGHQTAGQFNPSLWNIYRVRGQEIGLLLMSEHPEQRIWELVYMGLIPEVRGRRYGRAMLLDGLYAARVAGVEAVLLSVDTRNTYAIKVYDDIGFFRLARRSVFARLGPPRR